MDRKQAEAVAESAREAAASAATAVLADRDTLATKADIQALEVRMVDRMARWFVWHFAGTVALAGLIVAALKYLP